MDRFSYLTLMFLTIFLLSGGVGRADQHDQLLPLLGNLDGWEAQPAQGMSLISAQMKMITTSRVYNRSDQNLTLNINVNSGTVLDSDRQESSSESETIREQIRQIDGFWVKSSHTKKNSSGEVIVFLDYNQDASGMLIADYSQMSTDEVLQVIRSIDWLKLKRAVAKLL